ncbi:MAG: response regulator [Chloroflexi bacterium]|nr:response regulator [Chloroflexota bacterium]
MKTILVIDDTPDFLALVAMQLENEHYRVFVRSVGTGTVEAVRERRPDLVILDLLLPDRSGLEVLQDLKADPQTQHVPVIIVSGARALIRQHRKELRSQVAAILEKPFDLDDLLRAVAGAIGRSSVRT